MAEQTLRPYTPTWRDRLGSYLYDMTSKSPEARNFVGGLVGSTGLGTTGMSVADATPLGMGLQFQESAQHGDPKGMAMAVLPMPAKAGAGMMRAPYVRKLSPQGLYSWGAEAAYNLPQENMTVQQARSMLEKAGTKPDEFHWSGFHDAFPDPNAKVSRDQLVSHFENNVPQLGETLLGHNPEIDRLSDKIDAIHEATTNAPFIVRNGRSGFTSQSFPTYEAAQEYLGGMPESLRPDLFIRHEPNPMNEAAFDRLTTQRRRLKEEERPTKFGGYTLPGGDNYREVLTTLPKDTSEYDAYLKSLREKYPDDPPDDLPLTSREWHALSTLKDMPTGREFKSTHWDEPNVLAHLRLSDRTDAGGNKVLHMEESQSDWGQAARKQGIKDPSQPQGLTAEETAELQALRSMPSDQQTPEHFARFNELMDLGDKRLKGVPNAPYIGSTGNKSATGWTDLNLKRALWEAAQNDADALAWTPGADQAARYDLSKSLDTLHYYPNTGELMGSQGGNTLISKVVPKDKLADFVGKDVAQKLLETQPTMVGNEPIHKLSGQELSVGGEGMKAYYDRTIPTQLGAVMKRAGIEGGELGTTHVFPHSVDMIDPESETKALPALRLTPAMREQIKKGLPYFGLAPVGLGMVPKEDRER